MIEQLEHFPPGVLAFVGKGRVTGRDYRDVLVPAVEDALKHSDKLRLYYRLDPDFAGFEPDAMWQDVRVGVEHLTRWERIAVVTDVGWIVQAVNAFRFLMPARVKTFALSEADRARDWILASTTPAASSRPPLSGDEKSERRDSRNQF